MNREEMLAEIEALKLDAYDPLFPHKNAAQAEIKRLMEILFPEPDPVIQAEEDLAMYEMSVAPEITFEELFGVKL